MNVDDIKDYVLTNKKPLVIGVVIGFVVSRILK